MTIAITNVALTSNIATLTTDVAHQIPAISDGSPTIIAVDGLAHSVLKGVWEITSVTPFTISFAVTSGNITSVADSGTLFQYSGEALRVSGLRDAESVPTNARIMLDDPAKAGSEGLSTILLRDVLASLEDTEFLEPVIFAQSGIILRGTSNTTTFASVAIGARTVGFPDASGTVALLESNQTWPGVQTLTTPVLGVATVTTINKVTITTPAAGSTLTIVNGATLTATGNASVIGTNTGDQTITLTGDVSGGGTGSFTTTLATVNASPGVYTNANIIVDAKGRVTLATSGSAGNPGTVTTVGSSGSTLSITSPTTAPNIELNLNHANTWVGVQTLTTPVLGVAAATSINKVTITAPSSGSTLTIADGFTLTASANANVSGTNTGDQTITLTGAVTGSGTGSFATTLDRATAYTWTALQTHKVSDSATNTITNAMVLTHNSNGSIAASYGTGLLFQGQDSTTADQDMVAINSAWYTATHASRSSYIGFQTVTNAGSLTNAFFVGSGISGGTASLVAGGLNSTNGGIWCNAVTPSGTNYAFAANSSGTNLNAPSGGTTNFCINNVVVGSYTASAISFSQPATTTIADASTATVTSCLTLSHNCTTLANTAASFGTGLNFKGGTTTTADQDMAGLQAVWTTATHASRTSQILIQNVVNASSLQTGLAVGSGIASSSTYFIAGGYDGNYAGLWSNAATPSTTNFALISRSTSTQINATSTVVATVSGITVLTIAAASISIVQPVTTTISDAATATVTNVLTLGHNTSGTAAASFGTGMKFIGQDSTTTNQDMTSIQAVWMTATHASRASQMLLQTVSNAGSLVTGAAIGSGISAATLYPIIGCLSSTVAGIWSGSFTTPSVSNYSVYISSSLCGLNASTGGSVFLSINNSATAQITVTSTTFAILDALNITTGATTGSKIATATTQKLGFWNATPIVQPATTGTTVLTSAGSGTALKSDSTSVGNTGATAYSLSDVISNLKASGLLAA